MQQQHVAFTRIGQRALQRIEIGRPAVRRMSEGGQFEAEVAYDLRVVRPARRAHQHARRPGALGQRQRQAHRAGAAGGLHPIDTSAMGRIAAEDIRHQPMDEAHVAFRPEIGLGVLLIDKLLLGRLDRTEHRRGALPRAIDPHAEIDLVGTRIGVVQLDQREEGIGRLLVESVEHGRALDSRPARYQAAIGSRAEVLLSP